MPATYSPRLFAPITDPFLLADMRGLDLEPEHCIGNSHAFVIAEFDDGTAECACGGLLRAPRADEQAWAELVHDTTGRQHCPPYSCPCCYRVHNLPPEGRYLSVMLGRWAPDEHGILDLLTGKVVAGALHRSLADKRVEKMNAPYIQG